MQSEAEKINCNCKSKQNKTVKPWTDRQQDYNCFGTRSLLGKIWKDKIGMFTCAGNSLTHCWNKNNVGWSTECVWRICNECCVIMRIQCTESTPSLCTVTLKDNKYCMYIFLLNKQLQSCSAKITTASANNQHIAAYLPSDICNFFTWNENNKATLSG